jgi:molybdate transport system ATP-binding protein
VRPPDPTGAGLAVEAACALPDFDLDAAFEAPAAQTLVLAGPSGAGKSACLDVVAGLRPASGRIVLGRETWLDSASGVDRPPHLRRVGVVFQDFALFPHLTARQNVAYGARARRLERREARSRADEWLERVGLLAEGNRPARMLSGGERQRVALARALASEPRALLLDEPFASLDVGTRAAMRMQVLALLRELRLPVVLVTHDPVDALAIGDRIAVLERGRVTQAGTRDELRTRPRTPFVAELAGLNLFPAVVAPGAGLKEARTGPVVLHVLADDVAGDAFVAFAPAEVTLLAAPVAASAQNTLAAVVDAVVPLPDRLRVVLDAGVPLSAEVTREAASALAVEHGRRLFASVKATAIRVYR